MTPRVGAKFHKYYGYFLMAWEKARKKRDPLTSRFEAIRSEFYRNLWTESAHAVGATIESLDDDYYRIQKGDDSTFVQQGQVMIDSRVLLNVAGHKPICLRLFSEARLPVPKHVQFRLSDLEPAIDWLRGVGAPVVVKPAVAGSVGQGITTGVMDASGLKKRRSVPRPSAAVYSLRSRSRANLIGSSSWGTTTSTRYGANALP